MNISEKDTKILAFVLIVVMAGLFYFIPYKHINAKQTTLENEVMTLNNTYNQLAQDVANKAIYEQSIVDTNILIEELDQHFPADLPQELLIYTIHDIEKTIGIKFPSISLGAVEILASSQAVQAVEGQAVEGQPAPDGSQVESSAVDLGETSIASDVSTSTKLDYNQLKALFDYLYNRKDNQNRIVLNNLQLASDPTDGQISASFVLTFYGLKSPAREFNQLDLGDYDLRKDSVFQPYPGYGIGFEIEPVQMVQEEPADFFMFLAPITSDSETVVIGLTKGLDDSSMVYSDKNGMIDVEFNFYQSGGKYYYKYKAGTDSNPKDYATGVEFDPGKEIKISINSKKRTGEADLGGANTTFINTTDLTLNVVSKEEDAQNPRLKVNKVQGDVVIK